MLSDHAFADWGLCLARPQCKILDIFRRHWVLKLHQPVRFATPGNLENVVDVVTLIDILWIFTHNYFRDVLDRGGEA